MPFYNYAKAITDLKNQSVKVEMKRSFPAMVAEALHKINDDPLQLTAENARSVCEAFLQNTYLLQKLAFDCLKVFSQTALIQNFVRIKKTGLLNTENEKAIFEAFINHPFSDQFTTALEMFAKAGLAKTFDVVTIFKVISNKPVEAIQALITFNNEFNASVSKMVLAKSIVKSQFPSNNCSSILKLAKNTNLLTNEHAEKNCTSLSLAIDKFFDIDGKDTVTILIESNLFSNDNSQLNFDNIFSAAKPEDVAYIYSEKLYADLFTGNDAQTNRNLIAKHGSPSKLAHALSKMNEANLLTGNMASSNRNALFALKNPDECVNTLTNFGGLYQESFTDMITYNDILLSRVTINHLNNIPQSLYSRTVFDQMIQICAQDHTVAQDALSEYLTGLLRPAGAMGVLNDQQSTHTASVHATTDLTAWLLMTRYGVEKAVYFESLLPLIKRLQAYKEMPTCLEASDSMFYENLDKAIECLIVMDKEMVTIYITEEKKQVCLQLISYLIKKAHPEKLTDLEELLPALHQNKHQESSLSLNHFINLIFNAIEEDKYSSYMNAFINALYEIQRGYNLNVKGNDMNVKTTDKAICYGGRGNKFCELLQGLHPLIQFLFTNRESMNLKLKQMILEKSLTDAETLLKEVMNGNHEKKANFLEMMDVWSSGDPAPIYMAAFSVIKQQITIVPECEIYKIVDEKKFNKEIEKLEISTIPYYPDIKNDTLGFYTDDVKKRFNQLYNVYSNMKNMQSTVTEGLPSSGLFASSLSTDASAANLTDKSEMGYS